MLLSPDTLKLSDRWQTLEIISIDGKHKLMTKNIANQTRVSMDVSQLAGGVYLAILRRKSGEVVYLKFVK